MGREALATRITWERMICRNARQPFRRVMFLGLKVSCLKHISAAEWGAQLETKSKEAVDPQAALKLSRSQETGCRGLFLLD